VTKTQVTSIYTPVTRRPTSRHPSSSGASTSRTTPGPSSRDNDLPDALATDGQAAVCYQGKLHVFGGLENFTGTITDEHSIYDIDTERMVPGNCASRGRLGSGRGCVGWQGLRDGRQLFHFCQ
jgi:hypothetical protein